MLLEDLLPAVSLAESFFLELMTQLAADYAAKGPLILMTSSSVATGLAIPYSSFDLIILLAERYSDVYKFTRVAYIT